jgi:hypothetical protein
MVLAPLGTVLGCRVARRACTDLDGRGGHLPRQHRHRIHRLHLPTEPGCAVDRGERQGRINATGVGAFFNPLNFGQMYGLHVMLLPIAVTLLVVLHVIQVRLRSVVAPLGRPRRNSAVTPARRVGRHEASTAHRGSGSGAALSTTTCSRSSLSPLASGQTLTRSQTRAPV